jgi:hypothetical protein
MPRDLPVNLLRRHAPLLAVVGAGLAFRLALAFVVFPSSGYASDLALFRSWATTLAETGPGGFYAAAGSANYPPGYLYVLWLIGALGKLLGGLTGSGTDAATLALLKLPAILADAAIAALLYRAGRRWKGARVGLVAAALYLAVPVSWYDSALWGQMDAFGSFVLLAALVLLVEGWSEGAAALAVVAILVKPQYAIGLGIVWPVLVRRHLLAVGSTPLPRLAGWLATLDRGLGGLLRESGPIRLASSALFAGIVGIGLLLPFDITRFAAPTLADIPVLGHVAGLVGLFIKVGGEFTVLTANAYNPWALVGAHPLAAVIGSSGAAWTADSLTVVGSLSAVVVGALVLVAIGLVVGVGLLRRDGPLPILLGATILALAFYLVPTRVHERYLFPFFAAAALLAARGLVSAGGYLMVGVANAINLHAVLAGSLSIGRGSGGGGFLGGGGFGGGAAPGGPTGAGGGAFGGGAASIHSLDLPFAAFARSEVVVSLVAAVQTAALVVLLVAWLAIVVRPALRQELGRGDRTTSQSVPAGRDRALATAGSRRPPKARGQVTAIRAPLVGDRPTCHRPPVARTIASAIARPRPAPPGPSIARWKRSKIRSRWSSAMPGPLSSTVSRTLPPSVPTPTRTVPPSGEYLQALSRRTPSSRSSHSGGAAITAPSSWPLTSRARLRASATTPNRSAAWAARIPRSTGSAFGGAWVASNRANQSRSSSRRRIRFDSWSTRSKAVRYQATSRAWVMARLVWASMTESGVRSSCEASAVKSSWRWRASSIGVATRRPIRTAPKKTNARSAGAISTSARTTVPRAWWSGSSDWPTTR